MQPHAPHDTHIGSPDSDPKSIAMNQALVAGRFVVALAGSSAVWI